MRIGHGYDAHGFISGRPLILGGVTIPYDKGLKAHSDGDAVIHALCDALLGSAGLGDIGVYFPDSKEQYKNIDSRILLREVVNIISDKGARIGNVDITILAQVPKLSPYLNDMKKILSEDLKTSDDNVNLKVTTTEHMGFVGREEGIAVYSVVTLIS